MALVQPISGKIAWDASTSDDVIGYRVYHKVDDGETIDYIETPYEFVESTELDLAATFLQAVEGNMAFFIVAEDDAGNLSDPSEKIVVPLDTVAPEAPMNIRFVAATEEVIVEEPVAEEPVAEENPVEEVIVEEPVVETPTEEVTEEAPAEEVTEEDPNTQA